MEENIERHVLTILYEDFRRLNLLFSTDLEQETFLIDDSISANSQFIARQFCRASFALVGAIVFWARVSAAKGIEENGIRIMPEEWVEIRERKINANSDGSYSEERVFVKLKASIRNAFAWKERASGNPKLFDPSREWWCCLMQSIKVRDRLMHPRQTEDLHISLEELLGIYKGVRGLEDALYAYESLEIEK